MYTFVILHYLFYTNCQTFMQTESNKRIQYETYSNQSINQSIKFNKISSKDTLCYKKLKTCWNLICTNNYRIKQCT